MSRRKKPLAGQQWSPRLIEMLESPAYRVLSVSAHRVISRIEIEHASHGGSENGNLPVTKQNFMDYGMNDHAIAPAIREAEALGFIRMKRGRGGNAEHRQPNRFFLTFAIGRGNRSYPPTHEWRKIKTIEEAQAIANAARSAKDPQAVRFAQNRVARKTKNRGWTTTETRGENHHRKPIIPGGENHHYGPGAETTTTIYISERGWGCDGGVCSPSLSLPLLQRRAPQQQGPDGLRRQCHRGAATRSRPPARRCTPASSVAHTPAMSVRSSR
jgi:hypothetical protein